MANPWEEYQGQKQESGPWDEYKKSPEAVVSAGQSIKSGIDQLPRQLGLTVRAGVESVGDALTPFVEPFRFLTNQTLGRLTGVTAATPSQMASGVAGVVGLPEPATPTERVANQTARTVGSAATMAGAASKAAQVTDGVTRAVMANMAANPAKQLVSAAGAGSAGGAVKEAGGGPWEQFGASVLGGLAGYGGASAVEGMANGAKTLYNQAKNYFMSPQEMDTQITAVLNRAGVDYSQIPERVRQAIRGDVGDYLKQGKNLSPEELSRLVAFKTAGLTPTRGMITQDPVQITKEQNLAKIAANSNDQSLSSLPVIQNKNNAQLITNLNQAGASRGNLDAAGQRVVGDIQARDAAWGSRVKSLYDQAKGLPGGNVPLDTADLVQNMYRELAASGKSAFLPAEIEKVLQQLQTGTAVINGKQVPVNFDVQGLDNLMSTIATAQRSTKDGNVSMALSAIRKAIDGTDIKPKTQAFGGSQVSTPGQAATMQAVDGQPQTFMDALNKARAEAKARFTWAENGDPVVAALGGARDDNFIKKFVIGGSPTDVQHIVANSSQEQVKNAVLSYLKSKALSGASDETGKFSQAAFNRAMNDFGDRKLALLFSPEEIAYLKANGRAAALMMSQPVGSAVNNSNSGALMVGKGYDLLKSLAAKLPMGESFITKPLNNVEISLNQRRAANYVPGLLATQQKSEQPSMFLPALAASGGLLSQ